MDQPLHGGQAVEQAGVGAGRIQQGGGGGCKGSGATEAGLLPLPPAEAGHQAGHHAQTGQASHGAAALNLAPVAVLLADIAAMLQKGEAAFQVVVVAAGPGRVGLLLLAPLEGQLQLRIAPERGLPEAMAPGGIGQPQKESRRFSLRIGPAIQPSPDAHQTLVADVDHRIVPQGLPGRWHQEGPIAAAEVVDQLIDG